MQIATVAATATQERDWSRVHAVQGGDREQFADIYLRYEPNLMGYFLRNSVDRCTAEDLTSETFFRALRGIDSVAYRGNELGSWLLTIARNIHRDHLKSAYSRRETTTDDTLDVVATRHDQVETQVLAGIEVEELRDKFGELTDNQQECVFLRCVAGYSVGETASRMNRSKGAIQALLCRSLARLRTATEGEHLSSPFREGASRMRATPE